jgi:hypothetical protein
MPKLLLDHDYDRPFPAVDRSPFSNHGRIIDSTFDPNGAQAGSGSLRMASPKSAVRIAIRPCWRSLGELFVEAQVRVTPAAARRNIIEGDGSFALYVNDDETLVASVFGPVDGAAGPAWNLLTSGLHSPDGVPQRVPPNQWCKVTFHHDGLTRARLFLDLKLVGVRGDYRSGVGGVGDAGVVIGNWTLTDQFAFVGAIDRVRVWSRDELEPINQFAARPISPAARDLWDEIWLCMASLNPDRRAQFARVSRSWEELFRRFARAVQAAADADRAELHRLLKAYRTHWLANTIGDPAHADALAAFRDLIVRLAGAAWVSDARQLASIVVDLFEGAVCVEPGRLAALDPQFAKFVAEAVSRLA